MIGIGKPAWLSRTADIPPGQGIIMPLAARWQCDLRDDSLIWSPGVFDLFGIDRGVRVDRRDVVAQYMPESRALLERLRGDAVRRGSSFTFDAEIQRLDGQRRWMRVTADVVMSGGRVTHLYGQKQDITAAVASGAA